MAGVLHASRDAFEHIVVDAGSSFTEAALASLDGADHVLMVLTPELTTLNAVHQARRILIEGLGVPAERVHFVLNHPSAFEGLTRVQVEAALEHPVVWEIPHGAHAPSAAALKGIPLVRHDSRNVAAKAIAALAEQFVIARRAGLQERASAA
jgi:pilus assembly protein CpaE